MKIYADENVEHSIIEGLQYDLPN